MMASVFPWHNPVILRALPSFLVVSDILILLLAPALGLAVFAPLKENGFRRQDPYLRKSVVALMSLCSCPLDRHTCIHKTHTCVHTSIYPLSSIYHSPSRHIFIYSSICLSIQLVIMSPINLFIYLLILSFNYHPSIHLSICVSSFSSIHPPIHPHIINLSIYLFTCGLIHPFS